MFGQLDYKMHNKLICSIWINFICLCVINTCIVISLTVNRMSKCINLTEKQPEVTFMQKKKKTKPLHDVESRLAEITWSNCHYWVSLSWLWSPLYIKVFSISVKHCCGEILFHSSFNQVEVWATAAPCCLRSLFCCIRGCSWNLSCAVIFLVERRGLFLETLPNKPDVFVLFSNYIIMNFNI